MRFWRNNKLKFILSIAVMVLILAPIVAGCTATTTQPKGWSGVAITSDKLFIGSSTGKLVGMEKDTGNRLFNDISLETGSSGGFLGCGAAPITVAIYGTPVIVGDTVYVAGYNGKIYPISIVESETDIAPKIGQPYQPELGPQPIVGGLAIYQNALLFGTASGYVFSIDIASRTQNWEPFKTGNKIWATPLVDNGTLYIGSFDKKLYAIDTSTGKEKWHFDAGGAIMNTPVLQNNVLYFGTLDRYFYTVDATNGSLIWKSSEMAGKWFWANPLIVNNVIYAPNMDGKVYVLNAENGQNIIAPIVIGSPISSSPVLVGNKIILAAEDGKVCSINTDNNTETLLVDLGGNIRISSKIKIAAPLSSNQNILYIHGQDNLLYAVNADTGVIIWSKSLASN